MDLLEELEIFISDLDKYHSLIYYIKDKTIWFLTIGKHKEAYKQYLKRLYSLKAKIK